MRSHFLVMHHEQGPSNAAPNLKPQNLQIMQTMSITFFILWFSMFLSKYKTCFKYFYSQTNVFTTMVSASQLQQSGTLCLSVCLSSCLNVYQPWHFTMITRPGASPDQTTWGGQCGGCGEGDRVWGYNLKLINTPHNDSIPETPWEKSGVDVSTPVHPVVTPLHTTQNVPSHRMRCVAVRCGAATHCNATQATQKSCTDLVRSSWPSWPGWWSD